LTEWHPDTCACEADVENQRLIQRCRTHNNYADMKTHNNQSRLAELDDDSHILARKTEREKPEFQRR